MDFGYAIIGCGWVAPAHAWGVRCLESEGVRLVGVVDRDLTRARDLAERFGATVVDSDYRSILARDDVHAVSICLPDFLHEEVAVAAAQAGKHVLCEKPLAVDVAGADSMLDAARSAGIELGVVFNHRYAPDNIKAKAAIGGGGIGRVLVGDVMHSSSLTGDPDNSSPWRGRLGLSAGGILSTQAIHFLDLLLWFMGPVASVKAWTDRLVRTEQDHEDTVALALRLSSGALATLIATNGSPITDDFTGTRVEVQGREGYVALEGDQVRAWRTCEGFALVEPDLPRLPEGVASDVVFGAGHVHEVMDFVRTVRSGGAAPIPGIDGRHLMAVVEAAYTSAREGAEAPVEQSPGAYSTDSQDAGSPLAGDVQVRPGTGG